MYPVIAGNFDAGPVFLMKVFHGQLLLLYTQKRLIDLENIDLVIFDLDGTLLDSLNELAGALNMALEDAGCEKVEPEVIKKTLCYGTKSLLGDFVGDDPVLHKTIYQHYIKRYRVLMYESPLYEGARDLIEKLSGKKKISILTNKREETSRTLLEYFKIGHMFDPIVGGDTLSVKKPSPFPIEHICAVLDTDPAKTVMVGDSHADIKAGQAAGTKTVGVLNGFTTPEMILEAKPDVQINTIAEMISWTE